jgi:hypothetical protein
VPTYAIEADVELSSGCDPAAVGATVTVELCGHWEHDGACRWPHNSAIDSTRRPARFRTLFVADEGEEAAIRARIESALRSSYDWRVVAVRERAVAGDEQDVAARLLAGPRA